MSESTPKPTTPAAIEQIKTVDYASHPHDMSLEEDYQGGDSGAPSAREAGVPYKYFGFDYQIKESPYQTNEVPEITVFSKLLMDPEQIHDSDWNTIDVTIALKETFQNVNIDASTKDGLNVSIRHSKISKKEQTSIVLQKGDVRRRYVVDQNEGQIILSSEEDITAEDNAYVIGTFTNAVTRAQEMIQRGFEFGTQE